MRQLLPRVESRTINLGSNNKFSEQNLVSNA